MTEESVTQFGKVSCAAKYSLLFFINHFRIIKPQLSQDQRFLITTNLKSSEERQESNFLKDNPYRTSFLLNKLTSSTIIF